VYEHLMWWWQDWSCSASVAAASACHVWCWERCS